MSKHDAYVTCFFTSKCCHAFNTYSGTTVVCSECGKTIGQLPKGKELPISVMFNEKNSDNISGDLVTSFRTKAKRFAEDPTYELCSAKCPKCGTYARYSKDPQNNLLYICSNGKCRTVFNDDEVFE